MAQMFLVKIDSSGNELTSAEWAMESGNRTARVSLYGKGTNAGDTAVDVDSDGHLQVDSLSALPAGEAHLGEVGGNTTSGMVSFTRPANTTAYTAKDAVGPATISVSGATNATPIVITSTSHGLATNDAVTIASVGGNTAANADWIITVTGDNTFSLNGSVGNGAYTSGGTITKIVRLASVARVNGGTGYITRLAIATDQTTNTARYRVWFYRSVPTAVADNAAFTLLESDTNALDCLGYLDVPSLATEGTGSTVAFNQNILDRLPFSCGASSKDIYAQIETIDAFTPASAQDFNIHWAAEAN